MQVKSSCTYNQIHPLKIVDFTQYDCYLYDTYPFIHLFANANKECFKPFSIGFEALFITAADRNRTVLSNHKY